MALSSPIGGLLLFQSRPARLDPHSSSCDCRTLPLLAPRTTRRRSVARRLPRFLPLYRLLPGLGRHLFLRQPLFCVAHAALYSRPQRFARTLRSTLPVPQSGSRHGLRRPGPLHPLEPRTYVPVGLAPCPRSRVDLVFGNGPQPILCRPAPTH